jgi:hypothetical protein
MKCIEKGKRGAGTAENPEGLKRRGRAPFPLRSGLDAVHDPAEDYLKPFLYRGGNVDFGGDKVGDVCAGDTIDQDAVRQEFKVELGDEVIFFYYRDEQIADSFKVGEPVQEPALVNGNVGAVV